MIPMVQDTIAIAIGAIAGAMTRYQTGKVVTEYITHHIHPNDATKQSYYLGWHTAFINITGSFLLGVILATPSITAEMTTTPAAAAAPTIQSTASLSQSTSSNPTLMPTRQTAIRQAASSANKGTSKAFSTFGLTPRLKLLLGVGFCGSYTTFSTYSVDVVSWMMQGQTNKALLYLAINNVGGIAAAALGMTLMKKYLGTLSK
jgi:fluoride ion exporter CrcB/FEX